MNPSIKLKKSNLKNVKRPTSFGNDMMAKIIYHLNENGDWRSNKKAEEFQNKLKRHSSERRKQYAAFVDNSRKNGTPTTGSIEKVKTFTGIVTSKENNSLLQAVLPYLPKKPKTSITEQTSKDNDLRSFTIHHFDHPDVINPLYNLDIFKHFMVKIHTLAGIFIKETMGNNSFKLFNALYPTKDPRYCFVSAYSEGTKQGISSHRDQVCFLSIVVALQGDFDEPIDNCLRISQNFNPNEENSKFIRLENGDAAIFQRLYHSIIPVSNRTNQRVTVNIFY